MENLKFLNPLKVNKTIDIVYLMCPMHIVSIKKALKELKDGEILEVLSDFSHALEDIPNWCKMSGHEFLGIIEGDDYLKFYIKKCQEEIPNGLS
ncbi:sulfurtransferase TusA family protein [Thermodesulfobium sp. 4217-1]|uniref:sulfurtransferase TusA family protein n=1 Tax=Thermodesulfobium sp. 4217-1 TaxID=3120013 RepID=UPI003221F0E6